MKENYDIVIVGAGLVGSTLALALANSGLSIAIVEAVPAKVRTQYDFDVRSFALSHASKNILQKLNLWQEGVLVATPIKHIQITNKGHFGHGWLHADEAQVSEFGHVVEAPSLLNVLNNQLNAVKNIDLLVPQRLQAIKAISEGYELTLNEQQRVKTKLLIAADGANSFVKKHFAFPEVEKSYKQTAIVANIQLHEEHDNQAFERFTKSGPLALLPLSDKRMALVWCLPPEKIEEKMQLSEQDFLRQLQDAFGFRLGKFKTIGKRQSFPLILKYVVKPILPHCVLLGNAAHNIHPVGGQGFNLSLRDVDVLAQTLMSAKQDFSSYQTLQSYVNARQADQDNVINFTDKLTGLFSNEYVGLSLARNLGLLGLNLNSFMRKSIAEFGMGIT